MVDQVLASYKLSHDSGFAPNPFWGLLTLATCKPGIRRTRKVGDWIAGFTSKKLCRDPVGGEQLIYLMQVDKVVPYAEYYRNAAYHAKIPRPTSRDRRQQAGDNMYIPLVDTPAPGDFLQVRDAWHDEGNKRTDLSGLNVLVAKRFAYFGRKPLKIRAAVRPEVPKGQSLYGTITHDPDRVQAFLDYVEGEAGLDGRLVAMPTCWPEDQLNLPAVRCKPRTEQHATRRRC